MNAKQEKDPDTYLSTSGGMWRVVHRGMQLAKDVSTMEEAISRAGDLKKKISTRLWNGDSGSWENIEIKTAP